MVFQYPLELLGSYLSPAPTPTPEDSVPMSTASRAPLQMTPSHRTSTAGAGNGHFSTFAPSEISRAGYFSNSPAPRGEVRSRTKVVTTQESEHTVYNTKPPRGPGPHGSRLSADPGSRPKHIQAYTAADIAAGLCPNPPPRPSTTGAPRRGGSTGSASDAPSLASTAQGDTSSERRERTRQWVSFSPSQSSSTQGVIGLGHRPSIGSLRGPVFQNPGLGAPDRTSLRKGASDPRARPSSSDLRARQSSSDLRARQRSPDLHDRHSTLDPRAAAPSSKLYGGMGEALGRRREPSGPSTSDPHAAAPSSKLYGGLGEALERRREPSGPSRSGGGEPGKPLKSAMKAGCSGEGRKSVTFAKEKSLKYYHGAGN